MVMGNEVRRYTESPGLALRVEMPFSRTTATRVPGGRVMNLPLAVWAVDAGFRAGCTEAGAVVCGPSGCWAATRLATDSVEHRRIASSALRMMRWFISDLRVNNCDAASGEFGCLSIAAE